MTVTVAFDLDGVERTLELHRVTGLDALAYRNATGGELDAVLMSWIERREVGLLADMAVAKWLWIRQNGEPLAPLAQIAYSVKFLPSPAPVPEPAEAADVALDDDEDPPAQVGAVPPAPDEPGPTSTDDVEAPSPELDDAETVAALKRVQAAVT